MKQISTHTMFILGAFIVMTNSLQALTITSSAFKQGGRIPNRYTCLDKEENSSIPFNLKTIPAGTKSLAWIFDDPDAPKGTWTHWVVFNVPPMQEIIENVDIKKLGGTIGTNSWQQPTYGGPCPPSGTHRYYLKVYALDVSKLNLTS